MNNKIRLAWVIRVLLSLLFLVSALSKLYPFTCNGIWIFEAKFLSPIGIDREFAKLASRILIGIEIAIAILLLLPYYVRKFSIPFTIFILFGFSTHLFIQIIDGTQTNCGCFGELLPMTPLQAFIKNIISIGLLFLILRWKGSIKEEDKLNPIIIVLLSSILLMFITLNNCSCTTSITVNDNTTEMDKVSISGYSKYFGDIDVDRKLLLFLDPTCDHCLDALRELKQLKTEKAELIPEIRILFANNYKEDTEPLINDFFEQVGSNYDYQIISVQDWGELFFNQYNTPGVKYLNKGQEILFFEGIEDRAFTTQKLLKALKK